MITPNLQSACARQIAKAQLAAEAKKMLLIQNEQDLQASQQELEELAFATEAEKQAKEAGIAVQLEAL